ncbi:putative metal-dependent hydrolase [Aequorivita sublithincola DSM 14238]|uniref:Putative metal-dependent hydrolase n=1 Tax=Aequorivita sublithincola (strain DSM 14238 / LMG 21431 / ACAM 643 / 9-3) TaxID=746697 RepID=I3YWX4_AEQSU|nr:cyclase family protein [Aequorivita sublithincola]AFL81492.1 putative metal-dependent hydrolase [Aequorivita sublithincola DSM 14238]
MKLFITFIAVCSIFLGCENRTAVTSQEQTTASDEKSILDGKIIDLTHTFSKESIYWVTAKEFKLDTVAFGETKGGYFYSANNFETAEHGGTHIDAPIHFVANAESVDQIPLIRLMGNGIKIDVSEKVDNDREYQISIYDFTNWEKENGTIPDNAIVLLETGFSIFYPNKKAYLGTDERGQEVVQKLHFPGLSPEAAKWLVANRNISSIGLDTASIDYGQSTMFQSHVILLSANIPAFENVANLEELPAKGFQVIALPMKIKGGSGGPLRIIAIVPGN